MTLVVDASVAVKWVLRGAGREPDTERALAILSAIQRRDVEVIQPPHWLVEVGAVLARVAPREAPRAIGLLHAFELRVDDGVEVQRRACELAIALDHHMMDTLYHAVALEHADAELVTADDRYWRKARPLGAVRRL